MFSQHTYEVLGIPCPIPQKDILENDILTDEEDEEELEWKNVALSLDNALKSVENTVSSKNETAVKKPTKEHQNNSLAKRIVSRDDYEEMLRNAWMGAKIKFEEKEKDLPILPRWAALFRYIEFLDHSSRVFEQVKRDWEILFTQTQEDKQYRLFKSLSNRKAIECLVSVCDIPKTDLNLTDGDKCAGLHFFLTELFDMGQIYMNENKQTPVNVKVLEEDQRILYYVAGFVVNKLLKSKTSKDSRAIGDMMREKDVLKVPKELREWIDAQNRKNLKYPTLESFEIFVLIMNHIGKYYNETYIANRKKKVLDDLNDDFGLKTKFNVLAEKANVSVENSKVIFSIIINTSINTCGNGHNKNRCNELKGRVRSKQLTTKSNTKEKTKTKIENNLKEIIRAKYNIIL